MSPNKLKLDLHVAVFAFPFSSHPATLLNIARRLASSAPNVTFSFFNTCQSNTKIFPGSITDEKCPNIKAYDVWDGVPKGYVFEGKLHEDIQLYMQAAPDILRMAVAESESETGRKVSCIFGDAFLWFVEDMAKEKGVPWVATYGSEQHSLSAHMYTDLIRHNIGTHDIAETRKDEPLDFIPGMSKIRVQDLPTGIVTGNLESFFARMLHQMSRALPCASAVCISSCEELGPEVTNDLKAKLPKLLSVGPLSLIMPQVEYPDTYNCMAWLDKQEADNSVAYVSFGTHACPGPVEIAALAEALEATESKFLWSLRDELQVSLPNGFVENNKEKGMVVPWAPQAKVLAHRAVGVFITHFGYNSIIESIAAEVPMIGRPFLGEQKLNGQVVEAIWGVGLAVEGGVFTINGLLKSLEIILQRDEGKKIRENIKDLRQLLEKAVKTDGSCHKNLKQLIQVVTNS